jgi:hypothetical protein
VKHAKRLDKASGLLLLLAFVLSKLRYIPFSLFSAITYAASLVLLLAGYLLWLLACQLYPDHPRLKGQWYAFSQFKVQNTVAALIGSLAILGCFVAFVFPIVIVPACWLFVVSNLLWGISQFHKMRNPPAYEVDYSSSRQKSYLYYIAIMVSLSILNAVSATLLVIFPPLTVPIVVVTFVFSFLISLAAFHRWLDFNFYDHKPDRIKHHSYLSMTAKLDSTPLNTLTFTSENTSISSNNTSEETEPFSPVPIVIKSGSSSTFDLFASSSKSSPDPTSQSLHVVEENSLN